MTDFEVDEERMQDAAENTERLSQLASTLVDAAVGEAARESGRTVEEQWARMGDHFAFQAAEQNPNQRQIHEYQQTAE